MEDKKRKRVSQRWPCGCHEWLIWTFVDEDTIEDEELERREPCRELVTLVEQEERAEARSVEAFAKYGPDSPEHKRAVIMHMDILAKVEKHYTRAFPTTEVLGEWPGSERRKG